MTSSCLQKNKKRTLIQTIRICSQYIGMKVGIEKYTVLKIIYEKDK